MLCSDCHSGLDIKSLRHAAEKGTSLSAPMPKNLNSGTQYTPGNHIDLELGHEKGD